MQKYVLTALLAVATLAGCDAGSLAGTVGSLTGRLSGKVYLPNAQVAIVAQGAGNIVAQGGGNATGNSGGAGFAPSFGLLARSDEKGVDGAKVVVTGGGKSFTGVTAAGGVFAIEAPQGVTYQATVTVTKNDNGSIVLTGYGLNAPGSSFNIDVAMNMVSSKIAMGGATKVDGAKVAALVSQMGTDLEKQPTTPTPTTQAEAAAAFDANASAELKTAVTALIAASK